jgi:rfaE bifunctional protein kinase chain/domain
LIRVDSETEAPISATSSKALLDQVKAWLPEVDVILFEDYDKGVLSAELIQEIIALASAQHIPTVVDPKKKNFFAYTGATLFKPNLNELRDGLGLDPAAIAPEAIAKTVADFKASQSFTGLFVTMSERGVYMDFATDQIQIPAHIRQIADVSGAGDTVISIAACALAAGGSAAQIAELANLGGGLVCESLGVVPIDVELLKREASKI